MVVMETTLYHHGDSMHDKVHKNTSVDIARISSIRCKYEYDTDSRHVQYVDGK